ncbi:MAG TPA: 16S rRNA processing protein RimM [Epulopiscium sp.]|nr:16S rRNA processing protein RimM [Candidatus Epulonipiscium sp.]
MSNYMEVGKIVNTHGIKGEFKVIPTTDDIKRFELLKSIFLETKSGLVEFPIVSVRYMKNFVLLKLENIDDMTEAEKYKPCLLKIPKEQALPLKEDEYYVGDLYNMKVVTDEGETLGEIIDILFTGSNDVYVIKNNVDPTVADLLIPAIKDCILKVDLEENIMTVHLLEGLRD